MKILYAASEAVPFCKTGGLADVAGSLPTALARQGAEVAVILPLYHRVREKFGDQLHFECYDYVDLAWRHSYCGLFSLEKDGVTWYFLDNEQYFNRPNLYGYMDDGERFGFFSRAIVQMLDHLKFWPDVIHCNDWQTALVPIYLKDDGVRVDRYRSIKTTLTIHNVEYQGQYSIDTLGDLFGLDHGWADDGTIMMDGVVNLLKGAILCADAVNAVSPTYADELKLSFFAHRLESILRRCSYKLSGVLNGIDLNRYNPATDPLIATHYSMEDMRGKQDDKAALQRMVGLREEPYVPVVGIVSRLVSHKGLDLICEVFHDMMELPLQLVVLGTGDKKYEDFFRWASQQYPGRVAAHLNYDESLSMAIYAGADLFLMPSKSEPCGLSQMIAMRYGTVPIVRETGGLKDTVHPYEAWRDGGNGFTFANYSSSDMLHVIQEAVYLYKDYPDAFGRLRERAMSSDFSWARSASDYLNIYSGITGLPIPTPVTEQPKAEKKAEKSEKKAKKLDKSGEKTEKKASKKSAKKSSKKEKSASKKKSAKKAAPEKADTTAAESVKTEAKKPTAKSAEPEKTAVEPTAVKPAENAALIARPKAELVQKPKTELVQKPKAELDLVKEKPKALVKTESKSAADTKSPEKA